MNVTQSHLAVSFYQKNGDPKSVDFELREDVKEEETSWRMEPKVDKVCFFFVCVYLCVWSVFATVLEHALDVCTRCALSSQPTQARTC